MNRKNEAEQNNQRILPKDRTELQEKRKQIQYILMRQSFIAPSFLPPVAEGFLRDDFNFSEYLGRVLSKVFTKAFVFSISSFIFVLGFFYFWILFSLVPSKVVQVIFLKYPQFFNFFIILDFIYFEHSLCCFMFSVAFKKKSELNRRGSCFSSEGAY